MAMDEYVEELIEVLYNVEIKNRGDRTIYRYQEGVKIILDFFVRHKNMKSRIFFIGNGGSSAIASHMTADFMKNGGMNTCSLYDQSVLTCLSNDYGYEDVFFRQLNFLVRNDDLLVAISSSGESKNIINAVEVAKSRKAETLTLTGFERNNKVRNLGDYSIYVPCNKYGMIESIHNLILQEIVDKIVECDGVEL